MGGDVRPTFAMRLVLSEDAYLPIQWCWLADQDAIHLFHPIIAGDLANQCHGNVVDFARAPAAIGLQRSVDAIEVALHGRGKVCALVP